MSKPKVAVITESPDDFARTRDALEYIIEPMDEHYDVKRVFVLPGDPKNGKAATKTELKLNRDRVLEEIEDYPFVVIVGNTPLQLMTGKAGISKLRGTFIEQGETLLLPINNPSVIRHDPNQEDILVRDLKFIHDVVQFGGVPETRELDVRLVISWDDFNEMMDDLKGTVSFDIETTCLYPWQQYSTQRVGGVDTQVSDPAKIVSIGFGTRDTQWIIPVNHYQSPWSQEDVQEMVDDITEIVDDLFLVMHNGKFDLLWMWVHFGVQWPIDFDTMMAHYMLDENMRHGLKYLAQVYCAAPDWEIGVSEKQGSTPMIKLAKYHAHDLYYTRKLRFIFGKMIKRDEGVHNVFRHIIMPCIRLFVEIEYDGVYIDIKQFDEAERVLSEQYNQALAELKQWEPPTKFDKRGRPLEFNWGSPPQLSQLLFGDPNEGGLGIEVIETTDAGNPSCSESVLKRLDHPMVDALLRFRAAKQQLSFFIEGWKPFLHKRPDGWYLHPSFKLHGTVTGRLSCEHPNLQQVPRDPRIRSLISAASGWELLECDLSQVELRIAAELARERNMIEAFINGMDVHWLTAIREIARGGALKDLVIDTASTWIQRKVSYSEGIDLLIKMGHETAIEINKAWKEYRKKAKAINFGYLYGMWWKKFKLYARDNYGVAVTDDEAMASRLAFFEMYPDYAPWHDRQRRYARRHGYVTSLSGRKRRLPAARSAQDTPERREAERQAINSPVQSFANELNLMAAIQLRKEFGRKIVRICGTVHDAILLRVKTSHVRIVHDRLLEIMTRPDLMNTLGIKMIVPLLGEASVGPWGKGVSIEKWEKSNEHRKTRN